MSPSDTVYKHACQHCGRVTPIPAETVTMIQADAREGIARSLERSAVELGRGEYHAGLAIIDAAAFVRRGGRT